MYCTLDEEEKIDTTTPNVLQPVETVTQPNEPTLPPNEPISLPLVPITSPAPPENVMSTHHTKEVFDKILEELKSMSSVYSHVRQIFLSFCSHFL